MSASNVEEMMAVKDIDFNEIVVKGGKKVHSSSRLEDQVRPMIQKRNL